MDFINLKNQFYAFFKFISDFLMYLDSGSLPVLLWALLAVVFAVMAVHKYSNPGNFRSRAAG
jgi:hypothetical protein